MFECTYSSADGRVGVGEIGKNVGEGVRVGGLVFIQVKSSSKMCSALYFYFIGHVTLTLYILYYKCIILTKIKLKSKSQVYVKTVSP